MTPKVRTLLAQHAALRRAVMMGLTSGLAACYAATPSDQNALGAGAVASHAHKPSKGMLDALLTSDGRLRFPADYREWIFLSSGHGMSYTPGSESLEELPFDNVFVDPTAFRSFKQTGTWPDGAVFVLEIRPGLSQGSINRRGSFQHGEASVIEIHAKSRRLPTGWAFFSFDGTKPAEPIPTEADCYSCHQRHGAVDTTFVQFYPTMLPIARERNSLTKQFLKSLEAKN